VGEPGPEDTSQSLGGGEVRTSAPAKVLLVDLDRPVADVDCTRAGAPPYTGAWILACRGGRPLGIAEIAATGPRISAASIEQELRLQLGADLDRDCVERLPRTLSASVVVPSSCTRRAQLERCVASLRRLDYPDYEVIVVDNRPAGAPSLQLDGVRVLKEPRPGGSAARNRGLAAARGEIVAFTDDDTEVDRRWLRSLATRFVREPEVAAVTGLVVPRELETTAQVWFEESGSGPDRCFAPLTFELADPHRLRRRDMADGTEQLQPVYATGELGLGSNMAFRADVLRRLRGFDVALGPGTAAHAGEDLAVLLELLFSGYQLAYEPTAIVHHTHRSTMPELVRQIHRYGTGFTAMLTALALRDPRRVLGLARVVPAWVRSLRNPGCGKGVRRSEEYPRSLARKELSGMLVGPPAYLRSRRLQRRWAA
jgi:GT2 family glycosyltransferase